MEDDEFIFDENPNYALQETCENVFFSNTPVLGGNPLVYSFAQRIGESEENSKNYINSLSQTDNSTPEMGM